MNDMCKVIACATTALSLQAAAADAAEASGDNTVPVLEEIVVTAQKQAQDLQETPISIATFSGEALQERGMTTVTTLAQQTPSLTMKSDFGTTTPNIFIRGVGSSDFNANVTGAVGVYMDEVVQSAPGGQLLQFFDVDRIEVLRGPQGTLYGRNTTAGAINVLSRGPTDELSSDIYAEYGRFNAVRIEAGVGGSLITDKLSARISGLYNSRDPIVTNTYAAPDRLAPKKLNGIDSWGLRGQLRYEAADAMLLLNLHGAGSNTSAYQSQHRGILDPAELALGNLVQCSTERVERHECVDVSGYRDADGDPYKGAWNDRSKESVDVWGANLKGEIGFGDYTLTSITAYENVDRFTIFDGNQGPSSFFSTALHSAESWQFSQEVRIASPTDKPFRWILGGFYFRENLDFEGEFDLALVGIYPRYGYDQDVKSWAVFGQGYYDLTDNLTATVGLRYSDETRSIDYASSILVGSPSGPGVPLVAVNPVTAAADPFIDDKLNFSDVSWRFGLDYKATDDVMLFASVSRGSKSGGFNGAWLQENFQALPLRDERLTAYEIGMKSELLANRLRLNVTGFYYDYRDLQIYILANPPGGTIPQQTPANFGARVYGGEAELVAQIADGLTANLGMSVLDTKITEAELPPSLVTLGDLKGNELPQAPRFSVNGGLTYETAVASAGALTFGVDFSYADRAWSDATNSPIVRTDNPLLIDLRVAFTPEDSNWTISIFGRNVTNRQYISHVSDLSLFGLQYMIYADPVTYGVSVKFAY